MTDLPVTSCSEAIEKWNWDALRGQRETFHKMLKSGGCAEQAKLSTPRLVTLIAIFCLLSWRLGWIMMIKRAKPTALATLVLTSLEMHWRDQLFNNRRRPGGMLLPLAAI